MLDMKLKVIKKINPLPCSLNLSDLLVSFCFRDKNMKKFCILLGVNPGTFVSYFPLRRAIKVCKLSLSRQMKGLELSTPKCCFA